MSLRIDEKNQVYVWVNNDTLEEVSPHFDYEEDACQWIKRLDASEPPEKNSGN